MLNPDTVLQNRYKILHTIGKGGMGAVYLAQDGRLGHTVALKETFFADDAMRRAFEHEARLLAGLRHSALPRVTDHFTENEGQFLVMEYIAGEDLETLLSKRGFLFPLEDVLQWADQLLDALAYLHAQNPPVVHRDIKPQNLKLSGRQIILLDFGLAKGQASGMSQTSNKSLYGYTPTYAPLEQIRNDGTDTRSDLYSLSATVYHLLTGKTPPDALMRVNAIISAQPDPLRLLSEANKNVPHSIARILHQALALPIGQRPANASVMRQMLHNARRNPSLGTAPPPTLLIPPAPAPRVTAKPDEQTIVDAPAPRPSLPVAKPTAENRGATAVSQTALPPAHNEPPPAQPPAPKKAFAAPLQYVAAGLAILVLLALAAWPLLKGSNNMPESVSGTAPTPAQISVNPTVSATPATNATSSPTPVMLDANGQQLPPPTPTPNLIFVTQTPNTGGEPAPTPAPTPPPAEPAPRQQAATNPPPANESPAQPPESVPQPTRQPAHNQPAPYPPPPPVQQQPNFPPPWRPLPVGPVGPGPGPRPGPPPMRRP
jgi:serine/threonine protein kinase